MYKDFQTTLSIKWKTYIFYDIYKSNNSNLMIYLD